MNFLPIISLAGALALAACGREPPAPANGNPSNGRLLLHQFGCGECHRIPGVVAAKGDTGPPLDGIGRRVYLAGTITNTHENMVRWIRDPKSVDPDTAMPDLQVGEAHARDIAAYLATLR